MSRYPYLVVVLCFLGISDVFSQSLSGAVTKWNNSFAEWFLYVDEDKIEGDMRQRWLMQNDWTEWDYSIAAHEGSIRQKWRGDNRQWEVRGDGKVITIKMVWDNDPNEWLITDNTISITLKTRQLYDANEWIISEDKEFGRFWAYTYTEGDPRDWVIEDRLDEGKVSFPMKMGIFFIALYNSFPK